MSVLASSMMTTGFCLGMELCSLLSSRLSTFKLNFLCNFPEFSTADLGLFNMSSRQPATYAQGGQEGVQNTILRGREAETQPQYSF
ncbi:hypothetical protein B0J14DRAFT_593550 [Halenospora varia]|nr:hypothetical protein B0J14DRAFT_593550 [Halenospora varia]